MQGSPYKFGNAYGSSKTHSFCLLKLLATLVSYLPLNYLTLGLFCFVKVELIGYAASDDELFLIYEYAQKGSLKSHLHDPQNKGKIQHMSSCEYIKLPLFFLYIMPHNQECLPVPLAVTGFHYFSPSPFCCGLSPRLF